MSITREARHLSGNDLGKTITTGHITGTIGAITHHDGFARVTLDPPLADGTHTLSVLHHAPVTITGQASPHPDNPHGAVMFTKYDPETRRVHIDIAPNQTIANLYRTTEKWVKDNTTTPIPDHLRPLGFTTVDEALGHPGQAELPDGLCGNRETTDTRAPALPVPADKPAEHPPTIPVYTVGYHGRMGHRFIAGKYQVPAHDGETARTMIRHRLKEQGFKDIGIDYTTRQDQP